MNEPVSFTTFDSNGHPVSCGAMKPGACDMLSKVWVGRLQRGEYSVIHLAFANGAIVYVRKLHPERNFCRRNVADEIDRFMKARLPQ